jgi:hypothetical protein
LSSVAKSSLATGPWGAFGEGGGLGGGGGRRSKPTPRLPDGKDLTN